MIRLSGMAVAIVVLAGSIGAAQAPVTGSPLLRWRKRSSSTQATRRRKRSSRI